MIKYLCDRCGSDMTCQHDRECTTQLPKIILYPNHKPGQDGWIELCKQCTEEYIDWVNKGGEPK